jgi:hypothetical protein
MAKRKVTVTVDEELVDAVQRLGAGSMSSVVNAALAQEVDRPARAAALAGLLAAWEVALGPIPADAQAGAKVAFDDLDGLVAPGPIETEPDSAAQTS